MTDHVKRMVSGWVEKTKQGQPEPQSVSSLVDSIHRMIREAERQTQRRCAEAALRAGAQDAARVAAAIRTLQLGAAQAPVDTDDDPT